MNDAYIQGFIDKCAEAGINPEALIKWSQTPAAPTGPKVPSVPTPATPTPKPPAVPTETKPPSAIPGTWKGPGVAFSMPGSANTRATGGWSFPSTVAGQQAKEYYTASTPKR